MKRKLLIALAVTAVLVGVLAAPALAGEGPDRYQITTTTYDIAVLDFYHHTFVVEFNPCDGSIAITGGAAWTTEEVTGQLVGGSISFQSRYTGTYYPGGQTNYRWWGLFPVAGGALSADDTLGYHYGGTVMVSGTGVSEYKNHGQYVKAAGGGADAAHSCIGMPIQSQS